MLKAPVDGFSNIVDGLSEEISFMKFREGISFGWNRFDILFDFELFAVVLLIGVHWNLLIESDSY